MTTRDEELTQEYDDETTRQLEEIIATFGFDSDGEGRVQFEAGWLDGAINDDGDKLVLSMIAGPIRLYGLLSREDVDAVINNLIDSAWELESLEIEASVEDVQDEADARATRDSVEEAIASDDLNLNSYLVLEGVYEYLSDTGQWAEVAEWFTAKAELVGRAELRTEEILGQFEGYGDGGF